jgi:HTH-type transcriptional regulator / antitoxin HigA
VNEEEYTAALSRINDLMDATPETLELFELVRLTVLVEEYEDEHYPIGE